MNDLIKTKKGELINTDYTFTSYMEGEEKEFCIVNMWPELLHPRFKDANINHKERYLLGRESLNKGQVKFELYLGSREELHKLFMYFSKKNYKHIKIVKDSNKTVLEHKYTLKSIYESNYCYTPGILNCENIMTIVVCIKNLEHFKKDLLELRLIFNYRVSWRGENLYSYNNYKLID